VAGDILQEAVRQLHPGVKIGKILIQVSDSRISIPADKFSDKFFNP
jgi:hypothetical protein